MRPNQAFADDAIVWLAYKQANALIRFHSTSAPAIPP